MNFNHANLYVNTYTDWTFFSHLQAVLTESLWAVDDAFPTELLPPETGLIIADAYGAEIIRMAPEAPLSAPRRKVVTRKFARDSARRLHALRDPKP